MDSIQYDRCVAALNMHRIGAAHLLDLAMSCTSAPETQIEATAHLALATQALAEASSWGPSSQRPTNFTLPPSLTRLLASWLSASRPRHAVLDLLSHVTPATWHRTKSLPGLFSCLRKPDESGDDRPALVQVAIMQAEESLESVSAARVVAQGDALRKLIVVQCRLEERQETVAAALAQKLVAVGLAHEEVGCIVETLGGEPPEQAWILRSGLATSAAEDCRSTELPAKPASTPEAKEQLKEVRIIWSGPLSYEEIAELTHPDKDVGLYQIYGRHLLFGSGALLYVGKSRGQPFATRILQHRAWLEIEDDTHFFVGRLDPSCHAHDPPEWTEWCQLVDDSEALTIHTFTPPYNSQLFTEYRGRSIQIRNEGAPGRLPETIHSSSTV